MPPRSSVLFFTAVFASLGLLLSGCGKRSPATGAGSSGPGDTATGKRSQVWRVGNAAEPQDLDPHATTGVSENNLEMALFEGLASEDPQDLHPVPAVAQSWDISPDGRVYTFHLRENLKWSNGEPLTADDFIQTYRRILDFRLGADELAAIRCPSLALVGEGEGPEPLRQWRAFQDAVGGPCTPRLFTALEGADAHCQVSNLSFSAAVTMDWLDETLG